MAIAAMGAMHCWLGWKKFRGDFLRFLAFAYPARSVDVDVYAIFS
jgi:hypothetical protein